MTPCSIIDSLSTLLLITWGFLGFISTMLLLYCYVCCAWDVKQGKRKWR